MKVMIYLFFSPSPYHGSPNGPSYKVRPSGMPAAVLFLFEGRHSDTGRSGSRGCKSENKQHFTGRTLIGLQ